MTEKEQYAFLERKQYPKEQAAAMIEICSHFIETNCMERRAMNPKMPAARWVEYVEAWTSSALFCSLMPALKAKYFIEAALECGYEGILIGADRSAYIFNMELRADGIIHSRREPMKDKERYEFMMDTIDTFNIKGFKKEKNWKLHQLINEAKEKHDANKQ